MLFRSGSLTALVAQLGPEDPLVKAILAGKSPQNRATELVLGTKVRDLTFRRRLFNGTVANVEEAKDPMIELARLVDAEARGLRGQQAQRGELVLHVLEGHQHLLAVAGEGRFQLAPRVAHTGFAPAAVEERQREQSAQAPGACRPAEQVRQLGRRAAARGRERRDGGLRGRHGGGGVCHALGQGLTRGNPCHAGAPLRSVRSITRVDGRPATDPAHSGPG